MVSRTRLTELVKALDAEAVAAGLDESPQLLGWRDQRGRGWLHLACGGNVAGDPELAAAAVRTADVLIARGQGIEEAAFTEGEWRATPLWFSIAHGGNPRLAEHLLRLGATPAHSMHAAAFKGDVESIRLLAAHGHAVDQDGEGDTPFQALVRAADRPRRPGRYPGPRWSDRRPGHASQEGPGLPPHGGGAGQPRSRVMTERPDFIRHWAELEGPDDSRYPGDEELMSIGAPLARLLGLGRIGIHHERLPPGRRTSYPHAESAEEEFAFVLEGRPDVWIDGELHPLKPGDAVAFPAGTGICHTFLNNTAEEVRLLVVGERSKPGNRIRYPLNDAYETTREDRWTDAPVRPLGSHDGRARPQE